LHLTDEQIDQLIFAQDTFAPDELEFVNSHLQTCTRCAELLEETKTLNSRILNGLKNNPGENDIECADRIQNNFVKKNKKLLASNNQSGLEIHNGHVRIYENSNKISLYNIWRFVVNNPAAASGLVLIAGLAIAFVFVTFKNYTKDTNPVTMDVKGFMLETFNQNGELLWKKNIDGVFRARIDSLTNWRYGHRRSLNLTDIDGDGKNELLLTGSSQFPGRFKSDSLYCFNYDGTLRWVTSPEDQKFNYAPKWKRTTWDVMEFFTIKTTHGPQIYIIAHVQSYGGTVISTLDPKSGKVTSSLYHSNYYASQIHFDMDGDGNDEIILGGTSSYDDAFVMILNSKPLKGVLPDFFSTGHKVKGNALYYILLPTSTLGKLLSTNPNHQVESLYRLDNNGFMALNNDINLEDEKRRPVIQFAFNGNLTVKYITYSPGYNLLYEQNYEKGLVKEKLESATQKLKDSIKYWDGDNFVFYPAKNKNCDN
jgi:hypothetical protein